MKVACIERKKEKVLNWTTTWWEKKFRTKQWTWLEKK
jgi:hypothetical protein